MFHFSSNVKMIIIITQLIIFACCTWGLTAENGKPKRLEQGILWSHFTLYNTGDDNHGIYLCWDNIKLSLPYPHICQGWGSGAKNLRRQILGARKWFMSSISVSPDTWCCKCRQLWSDSTLLQFWHKQEELKTVSCKK